VVFTIPKMLRIFFKYKLQPIPSKGWAEMIRKVYADVCGGEASSASGCLSRALDGRRDSGRIFFMIFSPAGGEVWVISGAFSASNGVRQTSQRSPAILDIFLSFGLPFPSLIDGNV